MQIHERITGALWGTAVGDALGVPVEGVPRREMDSAPVSAMRGGGVHGQPAGTWSDDTSMTLAGADSLARRGWDPLDQLERFGRWAFDGAYTPYGVAFGLGRTTRAALRRFRDGVPPHACGGNDESDNGNGALMRAFPVAAWTRDGPPAVAVPILEGAAALTHRHPRSRLATVLYGLVVHRLLGARAGTPVPHVVGDAVAALDGPEVRQAISSDALEELPVFRRIVSGDLFRLHRDDVRSTGYVVDTLEAALWCLARGRSFRDAVLLAVNLGGDTDTVAAVTGALAGARFGSAAIPTEWVGALATPARLEAIIDAFADRVVAPSTKR